MNTYTITAVVTYIVEADSTEAAEDIFGDVMGNTVWDYTVTQVV